MSPRIGPYNAEPWVLMKGGEQILTGTYAECMLWLTRHCAHPILQTALEQGYHIEPTTVGGNPPCKSENSYEMLRLP